MFREAHRSSSGALTVFAAYGLHTHVVTGHSQVWMGTEFPLRLDYGRSLHAYVTQRLQIQLELLMMSGVPLETCWAFNEQWNNKFFYKVASCCLFLLSHALCYKFQFSIPILLSSKNILNVSQAPKFCEVLYRKHTDCLIQRSFAVPYFLQKHVANVNQIKSRLLTFPIFPILYALIISLFDVVFWHGDRVAT
jgi:hypothetical protein